MTTSPTPEQSLLEHVERLGWQGYVGRVALHLQFSVLPRLLRRPELRRIVTDMFIERITSFGGRYFNLRNGDLVYIAREASPPELLAIAARLRRVLIPEPVQGGSATEPDWLSCFTLDSDYAQFLERCRNLHRQAEEEQKLRTLLAHVVVRPDNPPLDGQTLTRMLEQIGIHGINDALQRQTVWALPQERHPEALFDEIFVSLSDLRTLTGHYHDLEADLWLFRYLMQRLDPFVLEHLRASGAQATPHWPQSLNLALSTILTPPFQRFNDALSTRQRNMLIIELNVLDALGMMDTFLFIRDYLSECGYRVCLDGVSESLIDYLKRDKLGVDLIKLIWRQDRMGKEQDNTALSAWLKDTGSERVVLCHCDVPAALDFGRAHGLLMFQGREIDRRMTAQPRSRPTPSS